MTNIEIRKPFCDRSVHPRVFTYGSGSRGFVFGPNQDRQVILQVALDELRRLVARAADVRPAAVLDAEVQHVVAIGRSDRRIFLLDDHVTFDLKQRIDP